MTLRQKYFLFNLAFTLFFSQIFFAQTQTCENTTHVDWNRTLNFVENFTRNGLVSYLTSYYDLKTSLICSVTHLFKTTIVSYQEIINTGIPSIISIFQIHIKSEDTLIAITSKRVSILKIFLCPDKAQTISLVDTNKCVNSFGNRKY